jgi:hypothetical protein
MSACSAPKVCKKLDANCHDNAFRPPNCLGICIPQPGISMAKGPIAPPGGAAGPGNPWNREKGGSPPAAGLGAPQSPGASLPPPAKNPGLESSGSSQCPKTLACPGGYVCVVDPKNGNAFMCVQPTEICGGFRNDQCSNGRYCVRDPRLNW